MYVFKWKRVESKERGEGKRSTVDFARRVKDERHWRQFEGCAAKEDTAYQRYYETARASCA